MNFDRRLHRTSLAAVVAAASLAAAASARAEPASVVVVRHAEKAADGASDPGLSPAGQQRAQALVTALESARITSIITTSYRRTRETALPLARRLGIALQVVAPRMGETPQSHVAEVVALVRQQAGPVLVVGHSNTAPAIVQALGGPKMPDLCDSSYSHLFVVTPLKPPDGASVLKMRYGEPDPAPHEDCL
ncbi:phosphoglycerate mutase family protein [Ideonella sp. DXS29W]|uniref:Phosphoglycerate mutase family protein n=1 Tax=Ideonella lacteola TaxID=2984193 RepID=A0ABU9BT32_9BURK